MNPFDPAHPFTDDNDEDDIFVNMMYQYYTGMLLQPDPAPLLTQCATLNIDREEEHRRLVNDYFADNCVYQSSDFKKGMNFFQMRYDARGKRGFTGLQKCVAAIKLMAMGESPNFVDDYMRMSERTAQEGLYRLARGVVETFGNKYLRKPSLHDMQQLYAVHEEIHGFSGSNNDVNVLDHFPNFEDLLLGKTPDAPFTVNANEYKFGYYLTDGIYPPYSTFMKAF
ncbi:uncharacterized protein LOC111902190 [Lactuca sativa]|uniref:uncharacterized protein LOC111902190 n=1 Tax=Lactuca sativa TaxID=4236 RepID=UPI000CD884C1|nr:uncharacterized protein LOC111902190 [Lactuca sativa]